MKKLTTFEFIAKANTVHDGKYSYDNTVYKNSRSIISITRLIHGNFLQVAGTHLSGKGCPKCGKTKRAISKTELIKRAQSIHGEQYDYSEVQFSLLRDKIKIICPHHGMFSQTAGSHLEGRGCRKCTHDQIRMTLSVFTARASKVHNNQYDYSKSEYTTIDTKVCILCPDHGPFFQTPYNHLNGNNCPECSGVRKYLYSHFYKKTKEVHRSRYTYTLPSSLTAKTKIAIHCPEHGEFTQTIDSHISGQYGCPKCAGNIKWSLTDFLCRVEETHNGLYDYSAVLDLPLGAQTKVNIFCLRHGLFRAKANLHAYGKGCPKCLKDDRQRGIKVSDILNRKSSPYNKNKQGELAEHFLSRSREKHGNLFDYTKAIFVNVNTKIEIVCPHHGSFWQTPKHHMVGISCPECGRLKTINARKLSHEEFISRAISVHGNIYDYTETQYVAAREYVTVSCPKHGPFRQQADSHLRGAGCRQCAIDESIGVYRLAVMRKMGVANNPASLYLMIFSDDNENFLKLGITQKTKGHRYRKSEAGYSVSLNNIFRTHLEAAYQIEQAILKKFSEHKYLPERGFGGGSECFNISALPIITREFDKLRIN